ncbi:hypothetical protein QYF36_002706 [Acer negundo]|nr:hypothetical protein QYF36_002706 [Acer negundo]
MSDKEVVEAFRRYCPGEGLVSLSLTLALDVVAARESVSVVEIGSSLVLFNIFWIEHIMVYLSAEKRKVDEAQATTDRDHVLATIEKMETKATALASAPAVADHTTSSNEASKGEAGLIEEQGGKEVKKNAIDELNGANIEVAEQD